MVTKTGYKVLQCFNQFTEWKFDLDPNIIKLSYKESNFYLSWNVRPSPNNFLCLGTKFAQTLNIKENEEVFVSSATEAPVLSSIIAIPANFQEREIVELQFDKIQNSLLNQVTVVAKNQPIIIWVSKFCSVTLIVESLQPDFVYGRLAQYTEVHITEGSTKKNLPSTSQVPQNRSWFENLFNLKINTPLNSNSADCISSLNKYKYKTAKRVFRVHILPKCESNNSLYAPYHVFSKKAYVPTFLQNVSECIYKIRKIEEDRKYVDDVVKQYLLNKDSTVPKASNELYVKLFIIENIVEQCSEIAIKEIFTAMTASIKCIFISSDLSANLKIKVGGKIVLEPLEKSSRENVSSIEIFPLDENITSEVFADYVRNYSSSRLLLLNSQTMLTLHNGSRCIFKISPSACPYGFFDENRLKRINVNVNNNVSKDDYFKSNLETEENYIEMDSICMRFLEPIISECIISLKLGLGLHGVDDLDCKGENILICGEIGTGKTTVCKIIKEILHKPPYYVHMQSLDCKFLKGKKAEVVQKIIMSSILYCVYYQYSILFLDDLDSLTTASLNDEESTPDSMNAARISDILFNIITEFQSVHYISLVATCNHINKIGKKLRTSKGNHFFRTILTVPNLEKDDRIEILKLTLKTKFDLSTNIDWDYFGSNTEGWITHDLVDLAEKATFAALKRHLSNQRKTPLCLLEDDLSNVLQQCKPISLHGIQLYKGKGHCWSDIGGLEEVKTALIEILYWPLKYSSLFKNAPIKQQSGILLYGMPGTGKTMLAGAIAKECGLNMISIKGPELLSKYIGASEESVRNVFEKAQRAKPCVIFFDEFDSLAPRRGHDSTGVTDRVVNQLLTQLDGVEGREGVAVVAASSRPDLLDPALLRPGRLDKLLLCPLPDHNDRKEILMTLCHSHSVNPENLNLEELATVTPDFTGADLNAIFVQARLNILEKVAMEKDKSVVSIDVSQNHLLDSIKLTRPSLTAAEKTKYNQIYAVFSKHDSVVDGTLRNQKATLA